MVGRRQGSFGTRSPAGAVLPGKITGGISVLMESTGNCCSTATLPSSGKGGTDSCLDVPLEHHPAAGRLAAVLVRCAAGMGPARLSQNDMAAMTGTDRQEVAAALEAMRTAGIIRTDRNRMRIADLGALRRLARSEEEGKNVE